MGRRGAAAKQAGKALERVVMTALGGRRFPADVGGPLDGELPDLVVSCKHVGSMSLAALTAEVERIDDEGITRGKMGILVVKRRSGPGRETTPVVCMPLGQFTKWRTLALALAERTMPEEDDARP